MADVGAERQFAIIVKVDTHRENTDLSVVYTNDPVVVENSINTMEPLLGEDDKYKLVCFDLEYTNGRLVYDQKLVVTQLFVNIPDYRFGIVDAINYLKVLNTLGLSCQKLVNIQGQYRVWDS
ncbi:hypothetical protein D1007_24011 [Hordeum vulgare]|nr:hypothetical protein D1007_24011 [Hordeum vulgare]